MGYTSSYAQSMHFNHTMSGAAFSQPALLAFRESPMVGWQYNDNNSIWKSSLLSASIPLKKFGLYTAWANDGANGLQYNSLSLGVNKVYESGQFKMALALGLQGARTNYSGSGPAFPDPVHARLGYVLGYPVMFNPKNQLSYSVSAALGYKGLMIMAGTQGRTLAASPLWAKYPRTSVGLGYHITQGNWRIQALGTYTINGPWNIADEMIIVRYRFIEFGFGGRQTSGSSFYPKGHLAVVAKRFKLSYLYLNGNSAYSELPGYTWHEREISLLVGLHKKGRKTNFQLF